MGSYAGYEYYIVTFKGYKTMLRLQVLRNHREQNWTEIPSGGDEICTDKKTCIVVKQKMKYAGEKAQAPEI